MPLGLTRIWFTLVLLPFIGSCYAPTIKHEYAISPGSEYNPSIGTALLRPSSETMEANTGLEQGTEATTDLIVAYLDGKGLAAEQPTSSAYHKAVNIAANLAHEAQLAGDSQSVSENLSFTEVIPHLLEALESNADIIATPNMVIRTGNYGGGKMIR